MIAMWVTPLHCLNIKAAPSLFYKCTVNICKKKKTKKNITLSIDSRNSTYLLTWMESTAELVETIENQTSFKSSNNGAMQMILTNSGLFSQVLYSEIF